MDSFAEFVNPFASHRNVQTMRLTVKVLASIKDPELIKKILDHLKEKEGQQNTLRLADKTEIDVERHEMQI